MNINERIECLRTVTVFALLTDKQLEVIAEHINQVELPAGDVFIEQDAVTHTAYLILSGAVKVYRMSEDGREVILDTKGPGEIVGEMALLDGKPRSAFVETIQDSVFFTLTKDKFLEIINQNPQISINIIKHLVLQMREFGQRMEDLTSRSLTERTYNTLVTLKTYFSDNTITLSQEELAEIIGATRSRVTEALNELEKSGRIILSHKKIRIV